MSDADGQCLTSDDPSGCCRWGCRRERTRPDPWFRGRRMPSATPRPVQTVTPSSSSASSSLLTLPHTARRRGGRWGPRRRGSRRMPGTSAWLSHGARSTRRTGCTGTGRPTHWPDPKLREQRGELNSLYKGTLKKCLTVIKPSLKDNQIYFWLKKSNIALVNIFVLVVKPISENPQSPIFGYKCQNFLLLP